MQKYMKENIKLMEPDIKLDGPTLEFLLKFFEYERDSRHSLLVKDAFDCAYEKTKELIAYSKDIKIVEPKLEDIMIERTDFSKIEEIPEEALNDIVGKKRGRKSKAEKEAEFQKEMEKRKKINA